MRRNNMWNRIFHNKEVKKNIAECNKFLNWSKHGQQFLAVGIHRGGHVREESAAKDVADGYGRCQSAQQSGT